MQFSQIEEELYGSKSGDNKMMQVTSDQIKDISFQILDEVTRFCDDHGIHYFLVCGTALGAVRHDGFIPWDDDVDIGMPRPDYERFLCEYSSNQYRLCTHNLDKKYPYAFAKVCDNRTTLIENITNPCDLGVYIDIFPIDGLPNDENERQKFLKLIEWDLRILAWKRISKNKKVGAFHKVIQICAKAILSLVPVSVLVNKLDSDVKRYSYKDSEWVGHLITVAVWGNDVKPKKLFDKAVKHKFEAGEFFIPADYDEYLTLEYGDYMKLPPKEKQVAKHDFVAYWKE